MVIAVHTDYLREQWIEEADLCGVSLTVLETDWHGGIVVTSDFHGLVVTYSQIANNRDVFRKLCADRAVVAVADEVHHLADDLTWGDSYSHSFTGATKRLALSGTPFRTDNYRIPFVSYEVLPAGDYKSKANFFYGYGPALMDGNVVRPIVFPTIDGELAWMKGWELKKATFGDALTDDEGREAMRTAVHPEGSWLRDVIVKADKQLEFIRNEQGHPDAGGLIITTDTNAAEAIAKLVNELTGITPLVATSKVDDAKAVIDRFKNGSSKWIVAVKMISEGVDIKRLRVGVFATTTATRTFFYQVVGRVIRWLPGVKLQTAYFYFPMYAPLVRYMKEISDAIEHVVRFQNGDFKIERALAGGIQAALYHFVDSIATTEEHIYQEQEFSSDELMQARSES